MEREVDIKGKALAVDLSRMEGVIWPDETTKFAFAFTEEQQSNVLTAFSSRESPRLRVLGKS